MLCSLWEGKQLWQLVMSVKEMKWAELNKSSEQHTWCFTECWCSFWKGKQLWQLMMSVMGMKWLN